MIHGGKSDDLVRGENGNYFLKSNPSKAFILSIQIRTITKQVHKIHYTFSQSESLILQVSHQIRVGKQFCLGAY